MSLYCWRRRFNPHWLRTLNNFIATLTDPNKLHLLHNYIGHHAFTIIQDEVEFDAAVAALKVQYQRPVNEVYARHILASRKQRPEESIDEFLQCLRVLARDCNYKEVTAAVYQEESIRDSFIAGLRSN